MGKSVTLTILVGVTCSAGAPASDAPDALIADCPTYTSFSDTELDNVYCKNNCAAGYCPKEMCKCDEAALAAAREQAAKDAKEQQAEKKAEEAEAGAEGEGFALHAKGYIPRRIAGPWFYVADGLDWEAHDENTKPRGKAFKFLDPKNTSRALPDWMADPRLSGNSISLAFMNPQEYAAPSHYNSH